MEIKENCKAGIQAYLHVFTIHIVLINSYMCPFNCVGVSYKDCLEETLITKTTTIVHCKITDST